jgi:hypothetical protein
VFDLYDEALERYEFALAAWQKRQAQNARQTDKQRATSQPQADARRSTPSRGKPRPRR